MDAAPQMGRGDGESFQRSAGPSGFADCACDEGGRMAGFLRRYAPPGKRMRRRAQTARIRGEKDVTQGEMGDDAREENLKTLKLSRRRLDCTSSSLIKQRTSRLRSSSIRYRRIRYRAACYQRDAGEAGASKTVVPPHKIVLTPFRHPTTVLNNFLIKILPSLVLRWKKWCFSGVNEGTFYLWQRNFRM